MLPENYDTLHGWCTRKKATVMMDYIRKLKPTLSVELGVFGGRSLLAIALESKIQILVFLKGILSIFEL
jgi:hypothetical protein